MIALTEKWAEQLVHTAETGMGYQIATIVLKDGRQFHQSVIIGGFITQIHGLDDISFREDDIHEIIVTHDKWDFSRERHEG